MSWGAHNQKTRWLRAAHPAAMGVRFYDIWADIRTDISPKIDSALASYSDTRAIEAVAGPDARVLRKPFTIDSLRLVLQEELAS